MVWQAILAKEQCRTAADFVRIAQTKTNTICVAEIIQSNIEAATSRFKHVFDSKRLASRKIRANSFVRFFYVDRCSLMR